MMEVFEYEHRLKVIRRKYGSGMETNSESMIL